MEYGKRKTIVFPMTPELLTAFDVIQEAVDQVLNPQDAKSLHADIRSMKKQIVSGEEKLIVVAEIIQSWDA